MKRLIYLKNGTLVRPSCFAPKERWALKKSRPRYISAQARNKRENVVTQKWSVYWSFSLANHRHPPLLIRLFFMKSIISSTYG